MEKIPFIHEITITSLSGGALVSDGAAAAIELAKLTGLPLGSIPFIHNDRRYIATIEIDCKPNGFFSNQPEPEPKR